MYYEISVEYHTNKPKTLLLPFKYKNDLEMYRHIKEDFCKRYWVKPEDIARIEVFRKYSSKYGTDWKEVLDERY